MPAGLWGLLLHSTTCSALAPHFQAGSAQPEDTASAAAAEALFLRLLGQAHSAAQHRALQALLDQVWDSGYAFTAVPQQQPPAQPGAGPLPDVGPEQKDAGDLQEGLTRTVEPSDPGEQLVKSQDSAPGTPPAEESRWPVPVSQLDAADGWDEAEQLQPSGEIAAPEQSPADGWDLEDICAVVPELAREASEEAQAAEASERKSRQEDSETTLHAAVQATDPLAAADGWDADEDLALPAAAHGDAGSLPWTASEAQEPSLSTGEPAADALSNGWEGDADLLEALTFSVVANEHPTLEACLDRAEASHTAYAGKGSGEHAMAAGVLSAGSSQSRPGMQPSAGPMQSSSPCTTHDVTARGNAVPMHACWSALLQRMLAAPDRQLAGYALARLEKAGAHQAVLVSEAEADAIVRASEKAGEDSVNKEVEWTEATCNLHASSPISQGYVIGMFMARRLGISMAMIGVSLLLQVQLLQ